MINHVDKGSHVLLHQLLIKPIRGVSLSLTHTETHTIVALMLFVTHTHSHILAM